MGHVDKSWEDPCRIQIFELQNHKVIEGFVISENKLQHLLERTVTLVFKILKHRDDQLQCGRCNVMGFITTRVRYLNVLITFHTLWLGSHEVHLIFNKFALTG